MAMESADLTALAVKQEVVDTAYDIAGYSQSDVVIPDVTTEGAVGSGTEPSGSVEPFKEEIPEQHETSQSFIESGTGEKGYFT